MMKLIPNSITLSRIGLTLLLLGFEPLGRTYLWIYILCGVSDWLDGLIARSTGTTSSLGAKLDSIADMTLVTAALYTLYPHLGLTAGLILWIILIAAIRGASILTALYKFRTYGSIHTYGNKLAGLLLFITPILLPQVNNSLWTSIVCAVATLSAVEEWLILASSSELQLDRKGLFSRK
ncbi:CDP-alcohol phosphatidyltransferase family protein [Paenibacillus sp. MMS20-IR301]|uniref:CDP-alcohol phosphatidyltransferase family protein n=1 Tax=Paenibacillus sp. MMS20-IR301 TaxID=2895946 RepID=UPI0028E8F409|nr:CDP-alcohol phosphatidyltransferase family protein [Paenibacillus sp. MMS20-IR301]WNS44671.1 CDP-alcohol phosphatidyltransferase family protein [Paenibacillus sp. MMS20-IR301]